MPKKHRVKRQKYVEYLLKLEKERDAYLTKRKNAKRSRQACLDEESMGSAREKAEVMPPQKRHRIENNVPSDNTELKDQNDANNRVFAKRHTDQEMNKTTTYIDKGNSEANNLLSSTNAVFANTSNNTSTTSFFNSEVKFPHVNDNRVVSKSTTVMTTTITTSNIDNTDAHTVIKKESTETHRPVRKTLKRKY